MTLYYRAIARYALWIVIAAGLLTALFARQAARIRVEHSQEKYLPPATDPTMSESARNRSRFALGTPLVIGIEFQAPMGARDIALVDSTAAALRRLRGIRRVTSLADAVSFHWSVLGPMPKRLFPQESDSSSFARSKRIAEEDPLYAGVLVSRDWKATALLVDLDSAPSGRAAISAKTIDGIEAVIRKAGHGRFRAHLSGAPVVNRALQESAKHDVIVFGSLSGVFCLAFLALVFRRTLPVALAGAAAAASVIWTLGIVASAGAALSAGLAMIVPLTTVICVATSVHYLAHWFRPGPAGPSLRYVRTLRLVVPPSIMTGTTTAFGFASLAITRLESVREVGIYASIAVVVCMLITMVVLPALAWMFRRRLCGGADDLIPPRVASSLSRFVTRRYGALLAAGILTSAIWAWGSAKLAMDANPIGYFQAGSALRRAYDFVDRRLGGTVPFDVVVTPGADLPGLAVRIQRFEHRVRSMDEVGSCVSAVDLLVAMQRGRRPEIPPGAVVPVRITPALVDRIRSGSILSNYVWRDSGGLALRIAVRAQARGAAGLRSLLSQIRREAAAELPDDRVIVTGQGPVLLRTYDYLVRSQLASLPVAFLAVFLCVYVMVRRASLFLFAVLVNVYPILAVAGVMGWLGIPLDIATIMIASVALGLVVDNTIHSLYRFTYCRQRGASTEAAIRNTYEVAGWAMTATSIVLIAGFLSLVPSSFVPTSRFGAISAFAILVAYLADILLLPALLSLRAQRSRTVEPRDRTARP